MRMRAITKRRDGSIFEQVGDTDTHDFGKWISAMTGAGFKLSTTMPLAPREYVVLPADGNSSGWGNAQCPRKDCVGGFIRMDGGYQLCEKCGGDGVVKTLTEIQATVEMVCAIVGPPTDKKIDKLIEDM